MRGTHNNESNKYDYLRYLLVARFGLYSGPSFLSILSDWFSNWSPSSYCPCSDKHNPNSLSVVQT